MCGDLIGTNVGPRPWPSFPFSSTFRCLATLFYEFGPICGPFSAEQPQQSYIIRPCTEACISHIVDIKVNVKPSLLSHRQTAMTTSVKQFDMQDSAKREYICNVYSAMSRTHTERSGMDHTVLPANYTTHACLLFRKLSPDGATPK